MESGQTFAGQAFIDATYEGDLLAGAGVRLHRRPRRPRHVRRATGGVLPDAPSAPDGGSDGVGVPVRRRHRPALHPRHPGQIPARGDSGRPVFGVEEPPRASRRETPTTGRSRTTFASSSPATARTRSRSPGLYPMTPPLYGCCYGWPSACPTVPHSHACSTSAPIPGGKFDERRGPVLHGLPGANTDPRRRLRHPPAELDEHIDFTQGLLWFLGHDKRLPLALRDEANAWGLCKDEFADNGYWPRSCTSARPGG